MEEEIKKKWKSILFTLVVASLMLSYFLFVFDISLNSKYFVKRDFSKAFLYRKTGNCALFKTYLIEDAGSWEQKCLEEKRLDSPPIKDFYIKDITITQDSAFLQVALSRSSTGEIKALELKGEIKDYEDYYFLNYVMKRGIDEKRFMFILPQTKWSIAQEMTK